MFGDVCIGPGVRAEDLISYDSANRHLGLDGLVMGAWPFRRGQVLLIPYVGAGAGWMHSVSADYYHCPFNGCGGIPSKDTLEARVEVGATVVWLAAAHWAIEGRIGATLAPGADITSFPYESLLLGRISLGLRWGLP
jgi:hypothetical protein